jgi:hypothetical protein
MFLILNLTSIFNTPSVPYYGIHECTVPVPEYGIRTVKVKKLQYISVVSCDKKGLNGVLQIKSGLRTMLQDSLNETSVLYSTSSVQGHDVFGYNLSAVATLVKSLDGAPGLIFFVYIVDCHVIF